MYICLINWSITRFTFPRCPSGCFTNSLFKTGSRTRLHQSQIHNAFDFKIELLPSFNGFMVKEGFFFLPFVIKQQSSSASLHQLFVFQEAKVRQKEKTFGNERCRKLPREGLIKASFLSLCTLIGWCTHGSWKFGIMCTSLISVIGRKESQRLGRVLLSPQSLLHELIAQHTSLCIVTCYCAEPCSSRPSRLACQVHLKLVKLLSVLITHFACDWPVFILPLCTLIASSGMISNR